jgi:nicotinate-nucleotide adenylyltransferase
MVRVIGILGGTFDPPHEAHLILAEHARVELELDQILFVPAGVPPHKDSTRLPAHHRLAMLELATAGNQHFSISRVDLDRPAPHYSIDMVRLLVSQYPNAEFRFIIGADSFRDLPTWHNPLGIVSGQAIKLAVMTRPDVLIDPGMHEVILPGLATHVIILPSRMVDISSSDIVRRIRAGKSVRYLLPDAVLSYIEQHQLYKEIDR